MRFEIPLDGAWQYWADTGRQYASVDGAEFEALLPGFTSSVPWTNCIVPSVANLLDPSLFRFHGAVYYTTTFKTPPGSEEHLVSLKFAGVNYKATIWLNGRCIGEHEGGHTEFAFEVTSFLESTVENVLVVRADNSWGHKTWLPWNHIVDWYNYNGIHRGVRLVVKPLVRIADYDLVPVVEFASPDDDTPASVVLDAGICLESRLADVLPCKVQIGVIQHGVVEMLATSEQDIDLPGMDMARAAVSIRLDPARVRLWSPDDPFLYKVTMRLLDASGAMLDERSWKVGFRRFETRGEGFYLNNTRFYMRGTNRHEDHPDFGNALPDALRFQDLLKMKRANINCFRGSHYPPAKALLDYCDELGLLFIEEIPAYQLDAAMMDNPGVLETAERIFDEMHDRDKNHACLVTWSVSNECNTELPEGRAFHEALYAHVRGVDGGRHMVIHVSNRGAMDRCYDLADFVTLNIYNGWYSGAKEDFVQAVELLHVILADEDHELGPARPIVLTEFGAEGIRGYRSWDAAKWSEDYQAEFLRYYITECMARDWIGGTWTWMFSDTRVDLPDRPDRRARSYNNKGMVDEFRTPKLAFGVVRDLYGAWASKK